MYLEYWDLHTTPFSNVPSGDIFFKSPQHEEALVRLIYVIENRRGAGMLTGEPGAGKTTVSKALVRSLSGKKYRTAMLSNPALEAEDLVRAIILELGGGAESRSKTLLLDELRRRLFDGGAGHTVLIIDEAHVIRRQSAFEELRMLLNLQSEGLFLITLILLGQPLLQKKISLLQPLKERISVKYHLDALNFIQTSEYIRYRLEHAGADKDIFTSGAVQAVHGHANGVPLRINNISDRCLLIGMMRRADAIDEDIVYESVQDLR